MRSTSRGSRVQLWKSQLSFSTGKFLVLRFELEIRHRAPHWVQQSKQQRPRRKSSWKIPEVPCCLDARTSFAPKLRVAVKDCWVGAPVCLGAKPDAVGSHFFLHINSLLVCENHASCQTNQVYTRLFARQQGCEQCNASHLFYCNRIDLWQSSRASVMPSSARVGKLPTSWS